MAIGAVGNQVNVPQIQAAAAPATAPVTGGADATQQAIDQNMMIEKAGGSMLMQMNSDLQQETQRIEGWNQQRQKEWLAEMKKG